MNHASRLMLPGFPCPSVRHDRVQICKFGLPAQLLANQPCIGHQAGRVASTPGLIDHGHLAARHPLCGVKGEHREIIGSKRQTSLAALGLFNTQQQRFELNFLG